MLIFLAQPINLCPSTSTTQNMIDPTLRLKVRIRSVASMAISYAIELG